MGKAADCRICPQVEKRNLSEVFTLYKTLRKIGFTPLQPNYQELLTSFAEINGSCACNELKRELNDCALELFEDMIKVGFWPNSVRSYLYINKIYRKRGEMKKAERQSLVLLKREGFEHKKMIYKTQIGNWSKARDAQKAEKWYQNMRMEGFRPDIDIFNYLIDVYMKNELNLNVEKVLEEMRISNVNSVAHTSALLLRNCEGHEETLVKYLNSLLVKDSAAQTLLITLIRAENNYFGSEGSYYRNIRNKMGKLEGLEIYEYPNSKRDLFVALVQFLYQSNHKATAACVWEFLMESDLYPGVVHKKNPALWTINLHYMPLNTALIAVNMLLHIFKDQIAKAHVKPDRVKIITGRGNHCPDGHSVIKENVPSVLRRLGLPFKVDGNNKGALVIKAENFTLLSPFTLQFL
eukprot:Gb_21012 [translate_table: standard]